MGPSVLAWFKCTKTEHAFDKRSGNALEKALLKITLVPKSVAPDSAKQPHLARQMALKVDY
ncbi:MAG: hypothetical protein CMK28_05050 [Porticoccaceae bacterium]|nr:hypothetical protein [Porticoccaceae bacterium]|tara:strand:+ start:598 stop:780 length:183 start_codon:yes stop_codon:yes gene_type:complete